MDKITLIILAIVFAVYLVVGGVIFTHLEGDNERAVQKSALQLKMDFLGMYKTPIYYLRSRVNHSFMIESIGSNSINLGCL